MEEFNPALAIQADLFHLKERNAKKKWVTTQLKRRTTNAGNLRNYMNREHVDKSTFHWPLE
jgi:hypothetical protein